MAIIARRITAYPITARRINAATQIGYGVDKSPWIFDFNAKLTALPLALQRMNATFTRASTATVVQDGALVTLSSGQFGTSYDPVTGLYGYVSEPAATNLLTYSENLSNGAWVKTNLTATAPIAAPDGTTTAYLLTETSSVSSYAAQTVTTSAVSYTYSGFFKAGNARYLFFGLQSGSDKYVIIDTQTLSFPTVSAGVSNQNILTLSNGWYRASFTFTGTAGVSSIVPIKPCNGAADTGVTNGATIYCWGMQLETGVRATSYIATEGSTATRAADALSVPVANIPGFNSAVYTLFADGRIDAPSSVLRYLCAVDDGTTANFSQIAVSASETVGTYTTSASVSQASVSESAVSTARFKSGYSNSANSFLRAVGGVSGTSDVSGSMPASPTTVRIGCNSAGNQLNGYIFRAGIIPQALSQAQINGLTA